jgi:predicted DNA-binding transcriptional regulator AlpA
LETAAIIPAAALEIADRLNVQRTTVDRWLQRKLLPSPAWIVGGRPAWEWADIEKWAKETGRLK